MIKGSIHLPCGHQVENTEDYVSIEFEAWECDRGDFENGGGMATTYMPVCKSCLPQYLKDFKAKVIK